MTDQKGLAIGPPTDAAELRAFKAHFDHAFAADPPAVPDTGWLEDQQGAASFRLARLGGRVVGGLGLIPMGQWFGGRRVPMVGINAVAVAPEARYGGVASALIRGALHEARERGFPLSTLYPSTQPVYRRAGYEHAGVEVRYRVPARVLAPGGPRLPVRPLLDGDEPLMHDLYARRARFASGHLDRPPLIWTWLLEGERIFRYAAERDGTAEGYVVYHFTRQAGARARDLVVRDLVALTPDAARGLLALLAGHRSTVGDVVWTGSPADTMLLHLAEQEQAIARYQQWMLRLVDVGTALAARGYPPAATAEVHLEVHDDVLPWNQGRLVLSVAGGKAAVRPGGDGRIRVDVRGLAPIYSGYLSPLALLATDHVAGSEDDLAALGSLFGGAPPWMPDHF